MMTNVFVKADCVARHLIICVCDNGTEKNTSIQRTGSVAPDLLLLLKSTSKQVISCPIKDNIHYF